MVGRLVFVRATKNERVLGVCAIVNAGEQYVDPIVESPLSGVAVVVVDVQNRHPLHCWPVPDA